MKKLLFGLVGIALAIFVTSCKHPAGAPEEKPTTLKGRINAAKDNDVIDLGIEELTFDEKDSFTITKPLTIKGGNAKNATFVVQSKGVKLDSINHVDAVIVGERVADGEFTLSNCYNVDEVYVNGGGSNSVHFANTMIKKLTVNKKNVRIALDDDKDGATKIEKAYILQDCKLESDNKANSFESVVISEAVKSLDLAGSAVINEIVSTAAKDANGNVNITINVTVSVEIKSVDNELKHDNFTAVDENGQEVTGAVAFDTSKIKFEDKADVKEDAKTEISDEMEKVEEHLKPTYTINLTKYLYGGVFYRDQWSKDEDGKPAFVLGFDITKAFMDNGGLPKTGDVVEFTIDATFSETLPKMSIQFADNSEKANWWKQLAECIAYDEIGIEAGKEVSFTKKAAFFDYPVEQVFMQLVYSSQDLYAETVFKPKGWTGSTHKINLSDYFDIKPFNLNDNKDYAIGIDIKSAFNGKMPKKGDILELTLEGKFDHVIDTLSFQLGNWNGEKGIWKQVSNTSYIDTGKMQKDNVITLTKKVGVTEDVEGGLSADFFYSSENVLSERTILKKKNWNGTIKTIEADSLLWDTKFIRSGDEYYAEYNVTSLFDTLPADGDVYNITFKGKFDRDISAMKVDLIDNSPEAKYYLNLTSWQQGSVPAIKAGEEFTFDNIFVINYDLYDPNEPNKPKEFTTVIMKLYYSATATDVEGAAFTAGSLDNRKNIPLDYEGSSGCNTVFLRVEPKEESWGLAAGSECPFDYNGSDLKVGKWYKMTYNVKDSIVRDPAKDWAAEFKIGSWYSPNGEGIWKEDYVSSRAPLKLGEKQTVEYYFKLDSEVEYLYPDCQGYNVIVTYDSITLEEASDDYKAPTNPANF